MPRKITTLDVKKLLKFLNFDMRKYKFTIEDIKNGMNVELEHGTSTSDFTNITNNDYTMTFKIALAHLLEFPDYYERLDKMEEEATKFWKGKKKTA